MKTYACTAVLHFSLAYTVNVWDSCATFVFLFLGGDSLTWLRVVVAAIPFISLGPCGDLHLLQSVSVHECSSCPSVMSR